MLIRKRLILVVVVCAIIAITGFRETVVDVVHVMAEDVVHDIKVLRGKLTTDEVTAGRITSMEHTPPAFKILHIKANADVKVHLADTPKIVIVAPQNLHDKIELWAENDKLEIRMTGNAEKHPRFSIDVYCPPLSAVVASDNSTSEITGALRL
jgi:hypothetical protein